MVKLARDIDPQFFERFGTEPIQALPEWGEANVAAAMSQDSSNGSGADSSRSEAFAREFDPKREGRTSKLVDYSPNAPRVAAEAYRAVVGLLESQCSDSEAIDRLLNPSRNIYRLEKLNIRG